MTVRGAGARSKRSPTVLDNMRRQELAFQLYIAGASTQKIADSPDPGRPGQKLYSSGGAAWKAVQSAIKRHTGQLDTEQTLQVELLRVDALQRALWPKAMAGDTWAVLRIKELMEHRAKLLGLYKPIRAQVEVLTDDTVDAAIAKLEAQMNALDADAVLALDDVEPAA
jgi:hypothetical protein